jgi:hypothetical protein
MSSPPTEITSFIGLSRTEADAWIDQLIASAATPAEKVLAVSYCKKISSSDKTIVAANSGLTGAVETKIRAVLAAVNPDYSSLFVNLTPEVFYWDSGATLQSKWKFTQAQQNSLGSFITNQGGQTDMTWYVCNQSAWGRGFADQTGNVVLYKGIVAAPVTRIYAVLCGKINNDADPLYGVITNAALNSTPPAASDSNYWRLTLIRASAFPVYNFGSKVIPTGNLAAVNVFNTLAWSHQERVLDVATNTRVWVSNSLEPVV